MEKKIRVLIINTTPYKLNGITNVILSFYRKIDMSSFEIDFVVTSYIDGEIKAELESKGSRVFVIANRIRNPLAYISRLTGLMLDGKYDIVHAHGNSSTLALEMYAAKKANVEVRISHSHATSCRNRLVNIILKPLFFRSYTHGFACSEEAGKWLFGHRKHDVINNAFSTRDFCFKERIREEYRSQLNINEHDTVIGHVGGFSKVKNHHFLINIFSEYQLKNPNSILLLVGDGCAKKDIETYVSVLNLSDKVLFLGARRDVNLILNCFDVFVFPSFSEGLGIVLLEAQANGLPIVASDVVPKRAKVLDNFEFLSLDEGPARWSDVIERCGKQRNPTGCDQVMHNGYDIQVEAEKLRRMYCDLVKGDVPI